MKVIEKENRFILYKKVSYQWSFDTIKRYLLEFQNTGHLPVHSPTLLNLSSFVYFYSVDVSVWSERNNIMATPV